MLARVVPFSTALAKLPPLAAAPPALPSAVADTLVWLRASRVNEPPAVTAALSLRMAVAVSVTLARARAASDQASLLVLFDWARALVVSVTTERMSTFPLALTRDVPPTDTWAVAPEVTRAKSLDEVSLLLSAPLLAVSVEVASRLMFCPARVVSTMVTAAFAL